jgi:antitoxin HicB
LPGCITQIETLDELAAHANEARELWIESAFERGLPIPEPTYPEELSGRFNVRLPRSLHRALVDRAAEEGVSLNQLVVYLLSRGIGDPKLEIAEPSASSQEPGDKVEAARRKRRAA